MHGDVRHHQRRHALRAVRPSSSVPIRWLDDYGWRPMSRDGEGRRARTTTASSAGTWGSRTSRETLAGLRRPHGRLRGRALRLRPARPRGRRRHAGADGDVPAQRPAPAPGRGPVLPGLHGRAAARRLPLPPPDPARATRPRAPPCARAAAWLRRQPPRLAPLHARDVGNMRGYPDGYDVAALGTFGRSGTISGCPIPPRA